MPNALSSLSRASPSHCMALLLTHAHLPSLTHLTLCHGMASWSWPHFLARPVPSRTQPCSLAALALKLAAG